LKTVQKIRINLIRYFYLINSFTAKEDNQPKSTSTLWLYDSRTNPDGYLLKNFALLVSKEKNTNLISVGPQKFRLGFFCNFVKYLPFIIWHRNIEKFALMLINEQINLSGSIRYILVGSGNGFLSSIAIEEYKKRIEILEIQHGLLDESYLPLKCDTFYCRSEDDKFFLNQYNKNISLKLISNDLGKPKYIKYNLKSSDEIHSLIMWSKNPSGGISWKDLSDLEAGVVSFAREHKLDLYFNCHPRDNKIKFLFRHIIHYLNTSKILFTEIIKIVLRQKLNFSEEIRVQNSTKRKTLHISCFSSSFITETLSGDLVFNIKNLRPDIVIDSYSWIESMPLTEINNISFPLTVTEIKK
jgi:hypothetical protein